MVNNCRRQWSAPFIAAVTFTFPDSDIYAGMPHGSGDLTSSLLITTRNFSDSALRVSQHRDWKLNKHPSREICSAKLRTVTAYLKSKQLLNCIF